MLEYRFAYLFEDLLLLPAWFFLFAHRRDLRHKILILSLLFGLVGLISHFWYVRDYWEPITITGRNFGIEDFLFGFFIGGIGSVFYEELFAKKFSNRHIRKHHFALLFVFLGGLGALISNIFFLHYNLNSIYSSLIAFIVVFLGIFLFRKDLIFDALASGILCGLILIFAYKILLIFYPLLFVAFWKLDNLNGTTLFKIPIEEILWAFGFGMVVGPMYEFYAGLKFKK